MKKKRRTLKNRGYAKTTRKKKDAEIKDLEKVEQELKVGLISKFIENVYYLERIKRTGEREG